MAIKTLFIELDQLEAVTSEQSVHDKYERHKEKVKKFDPRQIESLTVRKNSNISKLNTYLNAFDLRNNREGGYSIVSVTPVLGTQTEKVDKDEPMVALVHTTGFMVVLHRDDSVGAIFSE